MCLRYHITTTLCSPLWWSGASAEGRTRDTRDSPNAACNLSASVGGMVIVSLNYPVDESNEQDNRYRALLNGL